MLTLIIDFLYLFLNFIRMISNLLIGLSIDLKGLYYFRYNTKNNLFIFEF